jgi:hypothetical protein
MSLDWIGLLEILRRRKNLSRFEEELLVTADDQSMKRTVKLSEHVQGVETKLSGN